MTHDLFIRRLRARADDGQTVSAYEVLKHLTEHGLLELPADHVKPPAPAVTQPDTPPSEPEPVPDVEAMVPQITVHEVVRAPDLDPSLGVYPQHLPTLLPAPSDDDLLDTDPDDEVDQEIINAGLVLLLTRLQAAYQQILQGPNQADGKVV